MISRRTIINLCVFFGLTFLLIGYGYFNLIQNPLKRPMTLYSYIDDTGGVRPGFTVALRGVPIGHVDQLTLSHLRQPDGTTGDKIKLRLGIDPGVVVPADSQVQVERANPLGEQQVDLIPPPGSSAGPVKPGAVLTATKTPTPPDVGQVVDAADRILSAVPTDSLRVVIHEFAAALDGRAQDLRTITEASSKFSQEALAYQTQFRDLLANAPPVLDTVAAVGPQLKDALDNTRVLADLLDKRAGDIVNLFHTGTSLAQAFNQLLDQNTPNLACLAKDLGDLGANVSVPANLRNLDSALLLNQSFFGPVNSITPVGTAVMLPNGLPAHQQTWLRVRLLLPPQQPAAIAYTTPNRIPDTYPGAACLSLFGAGVPAGSQADAAHPEEIGTVIPPVTPTVPVEHMNAPTPTGGGNGPGNVFGGHTTATTAAPAASAANPAASAASAASAAPAGHSAAATPAAAAPAPAAPAATPAPASAPGGALARTQPAPRQGAPGGHPETVLFLTFGLAGLSVLERRELARLRSDRRSRRRRGAT